MQNIFKSLFSSLLIALCVIIFNPAQSANIKLPAKGIVTNERNEPLGGATVSVKNRNISVTTNTDGKFSINVPNDNDSLIISYVGYIAQTVKAGSGNIAVVLVPDENQKLSDVVVVGFGTQKKVDLTGAVVQVSGKELQNRPIANVGQALQGKVANLNVTTTGDPGGPGTNASFNIRGNTSLSGGGPLYVVDGIPVSDINDINSQDIENISVLKDAASSAIYGARAPYGVILVTTKRGKKGQAVVSLNSNVAMSTYTTLPKMANSYEFAKAYNDASVNSGQGVVFSDEIIKEIQANIEKPGSYPVAMRDPANPNKYTYASPLNTDKRIFQALVIQSKTRFKCEWWFGKHYLLSWCWLLRPGWSVKVCR